MSFLNIVMELQDYIMIAAPGAAVATLIFAFIRKFIFKKEMPVWKLLTGFLLLMAILLIGYLTFMTRGEGYAGGYDLHAFRSYREAWNSFSIRNWQLVVFNIAVFMPIGFLLPTTIDWLRKGYRTTILGLLFSAGIEVGQYMTKLGLCELDDLINNTLGVILGYCIFRVLYTFFDDKKFKIVKMILALIPIVFIVGGFGLIYYAYNEQAFGNLPINYTYQVNTLNTDYRVTDGLTFDDNKETGNVYLPKQYNEEQAKAFAKNLLNRMSITGKDKMKLEESSLTVKRDGYILIVNLHDRTYEFACLRDDHTDKHQTDRGDMGIVNVKRKLAEYEIDIPKGAILTKPEEGSYVWTIERTNENMGGQSGVIKCDTTADGEIYNIVNHMISFDSSVRVQLISEQDAAGLLRNGYFYWNTHEKDIQTLKVMDVSMTYSQDTKGYYQPVYLFNCVINGKNRDLVIPAYHQKDIGDVFDTVKKVIKEFKNR